MVRTRWWSQGSAVVCPSGWAGPTDQTHASGGSFPFSAVFLSERF